MQCFRTAQLYFSELVNSFDIFAISEHCLFEEQLEILEASINYTYKSTAVSAEDNPSILSGKAAHGGVALFWKNCIKDMVTPLENIDSDRIVGIRCDFNDNSPLFILSVYLPAASHPIEEFNEYLDYLWALYDSLSKTGFVIVMGDFKGNLGNSLGERGHYAPNDRGVKLLDFANYFNLCPTNLLSSCRGPLELSFLIVGVSNLQLIISSCLTVYLIVLFPVKYLNRLLTIHQTISLLNLKLTTRLILVLLCLLTTVLTRELEIKLGGQNLQWKIF